MDRYCIDPTRILLAGHAQGAYLASEVACQRGDRVRGAALFAGPAPNGTCRGRVAMLIAQGSMDRVFPLPLGQTTRDFWARRNGCDLARTQAAQPSPCVDYAGCAQESPLRYCEIAGGHELPSIAPSATWSFFEQLL